MVLIGLKTIHFWFLKDGYGPYRVRTTSYGLLCTKITCQKSVHNGRFTRSIFMYFFVKYSRKVLESGSWFDLSIIITTGHPHGRQLGLKSNRILDKLLQFWWYWVFIFCKRFALTRRTKLFSPISEKMSDKKNIQEKRKKWANARHSWPWKLMNKNRYQKSPKQFCAPGFRATNKTKIK